VYLLCLTPVHTKGGPITWLQPPIYNDSPHTVPLTNTFVSFPFNSKLTPAPTPGCMPLHVHSPSEGVFNLSTDGDSSSLSDASAKLKTKSDPPSCCSHNANGQQERLLG